MTSQRVGIIGTGNMGRIHARVLSSRRSLSGVADTDYESAKEVAKNHGVKPFDNYDSMIEELSLDGVVISTPTSTHAKIAQAIANKHDGIKGLLIEKPLASTLADAERVADTLRKNGIRAVISHSEIYNPVVERALTLIKNGAIGKPRTIIHDRRGFVLESRIPSLGDVFEDIGVHDFDIMARISKGPAKLYAHCYEAGGIINAGSVMVKFEEGTEHFFHLSRQYAGRQRSMDVSGTKGTLVLDLFGQIIKVVDLDQEPSTTDRAIRLPERGATIKVYGEPIGQVVTDFLNVIEFDHEPIVGLDDGISALRIVEAARKSARSGKVVDIEVKARK